MRINSLFGMLLLWVTWFFSSAATDKDSSASAALAKPSGYLGCKCMKYPGTGTDDADSTKKVCASSTYKDFAHMTDPMKNWVYPGEYCIPNNSNKHLIDGTAFRALCNKANPTNQEENICCYTINEQTGEQEWWEKCWE
ncbi:hypothetical protein IWZ01DRAFT_477826 [Phyllosticta capitalensis]